VNNAGYGLFKPLVETSLEELEALYRTNVFGAFLMAREAAKQFIAQGGGELINIASTSSQRGSATRTAYGSSKFALRGMSECWRDELRRHDVRVMIVNPSEVMTDFAAKAGEERARSEKKLRPQEIADAVVGALKIDHRGSCPSSRSSRRTRSRRTSVAFRPPVGDGPVLLFDGVCALCNGTVRVVLRLDRRGRIRFAPLGGEYAARVLERHPEALEVDSLILVDAGPPGAGTERVHVKSDAVLRLAQLLGGPWRAAGVLRLVPRRARDWAYDVSPATATRCSAARGPPRPSPEREQRPLPGLSPAGPGDIALDGQAEEDRLRRSARARAGVQPDRERRRAGAAHSRLLEDGRVPARLHRARRRGAHEPRGIGRASRSTPPRTPTSSPATTSRATPPWSSSRPPATC
jgi:predicted DCC family thiol-disulfide oxidoreductase YuxK